MDVRRVPKVILGLSNSWGQMELVTQAGLGVSSVAFSRDGRRVVSGSGDKTVRIWNSMTGEVEAELEGHTDSVMSVAFSQDGSRVVSGSGDKTVRIWNVMTGEVEAELEGHTDSVTFVAFSQDGSRVVSGSGDKTVRTWNTITGKVEGELKGHTDSVMSVVFSQDGSWKATTGGSALMTTPEITLPDASVVHRAGDNFCIVYPLSPHSTLSLSHDHQWIMSALGDCWIPPHYCDFSTYSFSGNKVCFGWYSGRVIILDMTVDT